MVEKKKKHIFFHYRKCKIFHKNELKKNVSEEVICRNLWKKLFVMEEEKVIAET